MAKITPNAAGTTTSAAPTAKDDKKAKIKKPGRAVFANVGNADPKVYPFTGVDTNGVIVATPAGFDYDKNKRLKKKDFARPSLFLTYQAEEMEYRAKKVREKADIVRKEGDGAGVGKATRLVKMMEKVNELKAVLAAQGIDVDSLLANTKPAEKPEAKAEVAKTSRR